MHIARSAYYVAAACLSLVVGSSLASGQESLPKPLQFDRFEEKENRLVLNQTVTVMRPVTLSVTNAAGVTETRIEIVPELRAIAVQHLLSAITLRTVGGKVLDKVETAKKLKTGQSVLVVPKGQPLDDLWKQLLREDAIVMEAVEPKP